ncbi:MAG TPA: AEC family transporter, partial [Polyangiaceae bacterium]|nr:AEC family transporter [Polyangiaceae bacterium]
APRMASALALVCFMFVAGYCARRFNRLPDNAADVLNRFVIDICVPATILRLVPKLTLGSHLLLLAITPWFFAGLAWAVARVAQKLLRLQREHTIALFLATSLGNTSFLGFPLCQALLGEAAVPLAAVYDQLGSFLLLGTVAPVALARATAGSAPKWSELLRRVLQFPPFLALLLALLLAALHVPHMAWLDVLLIGAAAPLVPLAMFAVGLKLRFSAPRPRRVFALGLMLKLAIFPLLAWGISALLHAPPLVLKVNVLETAMPTMITAGALMMAQGVAGELAAAFVGWGLVLALITIPAWAAIL